VFDGLQSRHARPNLTRALAESRAVALIGARQVGKSTLARDLAANEFPAQYISLDDQVAVDTARADPRGFVAKIKGPTVIDEVQRAPGLLLAIKERLDLNQARGQFLLTGSANILTLPTIADALPGRVEYVRLWPFSQGELHGVHERFIDALLGGRFLNVSGAPVGRPALAGLLATGGYPEMQSRRPRGRVGFFSSYIASIIDRDLPDVANVHNAQNVERLLYVVAARSAALASFEGMGKELEVDANTVRAHVKILEDLFLIRRLEPWHTNLGSRKVKTAKLYVVDSGLLAFLIGAGEQRIIDDGAVAGMVLESFVAMELLRQSDWLEEPVRLYHYRDKQQREVDVVIEHYSGEVAGVEVKASATVGEKDFAGLRYLREKLGRKFKGGVVLYLGSDTLPFGERLAAVPLQGLWAGT
jgi:predicted AAA+ superfamily ATPase